MAIKVKDGYECGYCHKFYTNPIDADNCKDKHNLIYIALSKEDLNKLVNFIFLKDDDLINGDLVIRLQNYLRESFNRGNDGI